MAKTGNRKPGGGIGSRVNVEKGVRVGERAKVVNPRALSQIGSSLGNKAATGSGKTVRPVEDIYKGRKPAGGPGGIPQGNEVALNVGKGGPGTGRKLYGQSGSQQQYGAPVAGAGRIANTKGQWPD